MLNKFIKLVLARVLKKNIVKITKLIYNQGGI